MIKIEINKNELKKIKGGSAAGWTALGIIGGIFFLVGILDGIVRPNSCKE